ncbi:hypothetical protein RFI_21252 [Reticulomyxa filosa]|uniref:Uncharacterized protein n=1 Tax=Reticulomyxa filosa TaxID=46433 RepID=X6MR14_RETFI|nr:hypothetical protein RFI_21252 [Reticulomyxa filosa]|eukprot:ETO16106.1 hypothetical protein RFI_21252 [Reticulomyxa filosa]
MRANLAIFLQLSEITFEIFRVETFWVQRNKEKMECEQSLKHYKSICAVIKPVGGFSFWFVKHVPFTLRGRDTGVKHQPLLHVWLSACELFWVVNVAFEKKEKKFSVFEKKLSYTVSQHIEITKMENETRSQYIDLLGEEVIPKGKGKEKCHYLTQKVTRLGQSSFSMTNELMEFDNEAKTSRPLFMIHQTNVNVDTSTLKPVPMESMQRQYLEEEMSKITASEAARMQKSYKDYDLSIKWIQSIFQNPTAKKTKYYVKSHYPILFEKSFEVLSSDLDWNGHLNQSEYSKFIWNTLCEYELINNPAHGSFFQNQLFIRSLTCVYQKEILMRPKWWAKTDPSYFNSNSRLPRPFIPQPFCSVVFVDVHHPLSSSSSHSNVPFPPLVSEGRLFNIFGCIQQSDSPCFYFHVVIEKFIPSLTLSTTTASKL